MKGQWLGRYDGYAKGQVTLNIDEMESTFAGSFILHPEAHIPVPATIGNFVTEDKASKGTIKSIPTQHVHPTNFGLLSATEIASQFPGVVAPSLTTVNYEIVNAILKIDFSNNLGSGIAILPPNPFDAPPRYAGTSMTWTEYKKFADNQKYRQMIFRGQRNNSWALRSAFHRNGRADPVRYANEDMRTLYRALAGRTRHLYDLRIPDHFGALLHLAQHHGYPTPLLDWTYSPYVAAFFVFRKVRKGDTGSARLFAFNNTDWHGDFESYPQIASPRLHITVFEPLSLDNDRASPQQSVSMNTNVVDLESYLQMREKQKTKTYLQVFDISYADADVAMRDLSRMGISAGSMFPGLDGICEELRERMFPNW